jgi:hypothetical protein
VACGANERSEPKKKSAALCRDEERSEAPRPI